MPSRSRTEILRELLLQRRECGDIGATRCAEGLDVVRARSLRENETTPSLAIRFGTSVRDQLASRDFILQEHELLIGHQIARQRYSKAEQDEAWAYLNTLPPAYGQTGHCEIDSSRILALGITGVQGEIRRMREEAADEQTRNAYTSFILALDGLLALVNSAHEAAKRALAISAEARRPEVAEIVASTGRLLSGPPVTFQDALQLYWLVWLALTYADHVSCVTLGHIDRWAYPFYLADTAAGRLSKERALELIECLYLHLNDCAPSGLAFPVMLGGKQPDGADASSDLSVLCMEALRRTNLVYPTVGIAWNERTPPELFNCAVELVSCGYTTPAFFGDDVIQKGMRVYGVPEDEAWQYINSACVEITPVGASNVWVASPYFSVCRLLLDEIAAIAQGQTETPASFGAFYEAYMQRLQSAINEAVIHQNNLREQRMNHCRRPLQSVFTRDCLGRGRDIEEGGALYNWVECSFVGLANLADALYVIEREIFTDKRLGFAGLHEALQADFDGYEQLRMRFLQGYPKYGQDCAEVDTYVGMTVGRIRALCAPHRMKPDGAPFVPGAFCWIKHEQLGRECGATPDGRKAGFAFADGCGPAQGRECKGPTAAILSTTGWDHAPMLGGLAMNMKFSRSLFAAPGGVEKLRQLILGFLRRGGFELQINVADNELLRKAKENPAAYADLVVRIGGYTDYFTKLSPGMQEEVLLRYTYDEA